MQLVSQSVIVRKEKECLGGEKNLFCKTCNEKYNARCTASVVTVFGKSIPPWESAMDKGMCIQVSDQVSGKGMSIQLWDSTINKRM